MRRPGVGRSLLRPALRRPGVGQSLLRPALLLSHRNLSVHLAALYRGQNSAYFNISSPSHR